MGASAYDRTPQYPRAHGEGPSVGAAICGTRVPEDLETLPIPEGAGVERLQGKSGLNAPYNEP